MAAVVVLQTFEYRGGQLNVAPVLEVENFTNWKKRFMCHIIDKRKAANLDQRLKSLIMSVLPDDQMNSVINCLTAKSTWDDLILYHEGPSDVKETLMNELVNDGIKLSKLEINTGFINGLPKKWLSFSQSLRNTNNVKDFELASLFDSPNDEEDTRISHEYLNDLEEKCQAGSLLAKYKRFFKKCTQRSSSAKATDQTKCHKCGKKDHFAKDCWSTTSVSTYQSPFQSKPLSSSQHKPELRPTKDFEAKYNKVKAKLALLSSSSSASMVKNKGLIAEAYEWDEEEVSSDDNEMVEVHTLLEMEDNDDRKVCLDYLCIDLNYVEEQRSNLLSKHRNLHVNTEILKENKNLRTELKELKAITETWLNSSNKVNQYISEQIPSQKQRILGIDQLIKDSSSSGLKDLVLILPSKSQRNTTDHSVAVTDSSATDYDSSDESSFYSTPLPPLKKLDGAEPISGPKTIKLILRSKSTFKAEALKSVIINEPSLAPAKGNKSSSASKVHSAPAGKLKSVKIEDDHPLAICERTDHRTCDHAEYISTMNMSQHLKSLGIMFSRPNIPRPSKRFFPPCIHYGGINHLSNECLYYPISCGSPNHTTTDHYDIEWFKRGEALQDKKVEALKSTRAESSNANRSKTPTKSGCSRHMTGVKSYLHKYVEQPGPKVVFGDDSTCTTKGYGSIKCNSIVFTKFDEKRGTIFNSNKEIIMIAPRVRDVYVLDMTSSTQESCFFAKASKNLNWLWHKRLAHLNFKTINKLAKQNLVIGLPHLYTQKINHVHHVKRESIIGPASKQIHHSYIHNHKDHLGKFNEKADDGYLLGYSLVSKASRVFNTRRQQTEETYHITFIETPKAIKFSKPSVDNINIAESERYPPDEYLHPYEPSQSPPLHVPSMVTPAPEERWSQDKHIELVNIIDFLSEEEPKKVSEALKHPGWMVRHRYAVSSLKNTAYWSSE
ncbi:retrovirus-related pol polyprotein from transposon TNT 1-94 [Tanacetum coccineum]|uniref:Retrovirus-related pol polyprotein from transposon TNT 1-94 n=1 Tax=Tanacetum coccineum TaxID=301880 RepID=A0ABQ5B8P6_9ASTR